MKTRTAARTVCLTSGQSTLRLVPICPVKGCHSDNACDPDAQRPDQPDDLDCYDFINTHTPYPYKPGLASCPIDIPSPYVMNLCVLSEQAKTCHILYNITHQVFLIGPSVSFHLSPSSYLISIIFNFQISKTSLKPT